MWRRQGLSARCFNTQPPEGGWGLRLTANEIAKGFNTQPPEGGWWIKKGWFFNLKVSTHSRLKAAGWQDVPCRINDFVSTHSRLKAAGNSCKAP